LAGAREVEQMCSLGLVELERARERLEHRLGDTGRVPALEPRVVVDADTGKEPTSSRRNPGTRRGPLP